MKYAVHGLLNDSNSQTFTKTRESMASPSNNCGDSTSGVKQRSGLTITK